MIADIITAIRMHSAPELAVFFAMCAAAVTWPICFLIDLAGWS